MPVNPNLEFLKLKVFLYKYTPPFTQTKKVSTELFKMDRYRFDLTNTFYTKYDLTDFIATYSFTQDINQNTFAWETTFHNPILPFNQINQLRVADLNGVQSLEIIQNLTNLAQQEAQAKNLVDTNTIENAKLARGKGPNSLTVKTDSAAPITEGLRLSDLIQPYDFISVFLYKNETPLEQLTGAVITQNGVPIFVPAANGRVLTSNELQTETILLSPDPTNAKKKLFSNEFNGFVLRKTFSRVIGGVDSVTISGNGITRLFGATRRLLKSSILQKSIFDIGEVVDPKAITVFQNIYANKKLEEIFQDLFSIVYRISFSSTQNFYDISSLQVNNNFQTNLFSIPPFLLALVMKNRGFSYREPLNNASLQALISQASTEVSVIGNIDQNGINTAINNAPGLQTTPSGTQPVFFSSELTNLRAYLKLVEEVFLFFNPELSTPFEIIDEIKSKTFLEFFETPEGVIFIRPPQYNDTTTTIFSSDLGNINVSYSESVENLVSRQKVGYGTDIIGQIEAIKEYAYSNGKLLAQYGFLEAGTDINPNVKNDKIDDNTLTKTKDAGLFKYAEYFLRIHNAALKTGTFTCNLDATIRVGRTFFDETNQKFAYITNVSKNLSVGGAATMNVTLAFVRDATLADPNVKDATTIDFESLPRLVDIAEKFSTTAVNKTVNSEPA